LNFRAISRWLKNVFAFWRLLPLLHDQNIAGRGDTKRRQRETVTDSDRCCRPGWHHIRATRALWWRCLPNATRSKEETTQRSTKRGPYVSSEMIRAKARLQLKSARPMLISTTRSDALTTNGNGNILNRKSGVLTAQSEHCFGGGVNSHSFSN